MEAESKTKEQLTKELHELRHRVELLFRAQKAGKWTFNLFAPLLVCRIMG